MRKGLLMLAVMVVALGCEKKTELVIRNEMHREIEVELEGRDYDGREFEYEDHIRPYGQRKYTFKRDRLPVKFELEAGDYELDIRFHEDQTHTFYIYVTDHGLFGPTRDKKWQKHHDDRDEPRHRRHRDDDRYDDDD